MSKYLIRCIAVVSLVFWVVGCCGVYLPTVGQVDGWVAQGIPPGTSVDAATSFLKAKGFVVSESRSPSNRRELKGDRKVGVCLLNGTNDYITVRCDMDESGIVLSTDVRHEARPGN